MNAFPHFSKDHLAFTFSCNKTVLFPGDVENDVPRRFPDGSPNVRAQKPEKYEKTGKGATMFKNIQEIRSQEIYDHLDEKWSDDGDDDECWW